MYFEILQKVGNELNMVFQKKTAIMLLKMQSVSSINILPIAIEGPKVESAKN